MKLPLLISVPHAGLDVPTSVRSYVLLNNDQIIKDGDEQAADIYFPLKDKVESFISTSIARAIVDLNRPIDDRRPDGVIKTHTCWNELVYKSPLPASLEKQILDAHYFPYHRNLSSLSASNVVLGIDCHTMAAEGPPIGPDSGKKRPWVCLSNANGTCPEKFIQEMNDVFSDQFDGNVQINDPFKGGYIIQKHSAKLPWIQLEISRELFLPVKEKSNRVFTAFQTWFRNH